MIKSALARISSKLHLSTRAFSRTLSASSSSGSSIWSAFSSDTLPNINASATEQRNLPSYCDVLICGGGIAGLAVARELIIRDQLTDVVIVDKGTFGSGSTRHGFGLISGMRNVPIEGKLVSLTMRSLKEIAKQYDIGLKQTGSVFLAQTPDRLLQLKRFHSLYCRLFKSEIISRSDIERYHPFLERSDLAGGLFVADDMSVDPAALVKALIEDLKKQGVTLIENCTVNKIDAHDRQVVAIETSLGRIECNSFVNAAGSWSTKVGALSNRLVRVPQYPCTQLVYTSQPVKELQGKSLPVVRDYDSSIHFYVRDKDASVVLTGFEQTGHPLPQSRIIPDSSNLSTSKAHASAFATSVSDAESSSSWDRSTPFLGSLIHRLPQVGRSDVGRIDTFAESYTPDGAWIIGKSPKYDNYFICTAGNLSGFSASFGMGNILASWIVDGYPPQHQNFWGIDIQRSLPFHSNIQYLRERVKEAVSLQSWPYLLTDAPTKLRPMRTTPLYAYQIQQGAHFFAQNSFERPQFFDPTITTLDQKPSFRRPSWFETVEREYWACRRDVAIIDMSAFTKLELRSSGHEAVDLLQKVCANNMDRPPGTVIHTGMLNERGGFENDCTVLRLDKNWYIIISVPSQHVKIFHYLAKFLPTNGSVQLRDVTSMYTALNVIGPDAEELLYKLSSTRLTRADFPAMTCKILNIAQAVDVVTMRLTHSGEDGFMLYVPNEYALHVYTSLCNERDFGVQLAGYHALRSLRIERFFLYWGSDLNQNVTPLQCDREARIDFSKPDFLGKKALLEEKKRGIFYRVVQLLLHPDNFNPHWVESWPWSGEPVYRNGQYVGLTTSCGWGYSLERMVCIAIVRNHARNEPITTDYLTSGHYEVEICGTRYPASLNLYPPKLPFPEGS